MKHDSIFVLWLHDESSSMATKNYRIFGEFSSEFFVLASTTAIVQTIANVFISSRSFSFIRLWTFIFFSVIDCDLMQTRKQF